ncbi:hypothetical protein [Novacetimonas hansenii]|uniref:hypothetical protein n=1 Tax=Novacetimonas hansenii TaxID=436 RepID=UPI0030CB86C6
MSGNTSPCHHSLHLFAKTDESQHAGIVQKLSDQALKDSQIEVLAIHLDLDVLDPHNFRSLLFAKPGRGKHDFGDVAEGKLNIPDVLKLIQEVTTEKEVVGMTIAEHMPWDALNLQEMLKQLPLIGG